MALLGFVDLTVVALVVFIRSNRPIHKAGAAVAWVVAGVALAIGLPA